jgi:DNA-binding SARP family transcriptional activator
MAVDGTQVAMHDIRPLPLTILKILAINANRRVSTDVLCEALWPDGDPSATSHRIQVAISDLRRSLPIGRDRARTLIRREGDGYRLDVEPDDHDLLALQARWARLRNNGIEPIELSAQLQSLVDDHRLDVLVDDPYAEWATDARDTVRGIVATATERLVDLLSATDPAAAVAYARIGLGFDPYRDRLWQAMIDALEASGQPLAAQSVRAEYAAALAEIGVTSTAH